MHLRYDYFDADAHGVSGHATNYLLALGITWQHSTPQSLADQFWFWNCRNVPAQLPPFITRLEVNPYDVIGRGLTPELAEAIARNQPPT